MGRKPDQRKSFLERFMPYERQLRGFFQRRMRHISDSEDLTQEVLLRAYKATEEQEIENPRAFLFGVARNVMMDSMAKKSRSIISSIEDLSPSTDFQSETTTEEDVLGREKWREFTKATADLPPQCRKVFILKKVYGYSNKEIAAKLKISTSTVEKHIAAGLRKVRDSLSQNDEKEKQLENKVTRLER